MQSRQLGNESVSWTRGERGERPNAADKVGDSSSKYSQMHAQLSADTQELTSRHTPASVQHVRLTAGHRYVA